MNRIIGVLLLGVSTIVTAAGLESFSSAQQVTGLKDALSQGAVNAILKLGKNDGYLGNPQVKIPLPGPLAKGEKILRMMGQGKQADELVTAMNRAAEKAVPEAKNLMVGAVKDMSVEDAVGILRGGDDAATQYFRSKTEVTLRGKFLPIVTASTQKVGLAQKYNAFAGKLPPGVLKEDQTKIENYVTNKALDGLFLMMAQEEKQLRQNPVKAGTDIAKKIFGALKF